ncbi:MAG: TlpA family protein disulfide reductase [Hyphomonadaceae bacterium]
MESDINSSGAAAARPNWAWRSALAMLAFGAVAILYVLFAASSKPEPVGDYTRFARGAMQRLQTIEAPPPMPRETLRDGAGAEASLAAYEGQVVVLNLWATWCAPCLEEMPTLGALQRHFEGRLAVVPVSVDSEAKMAEAERELARLSGGSLPFFVDPSRAILFSVRAAGMPATVIYDRDGRELARLVGGADWSSPEAIAFLEAALAES